MGVCLKHDLSGKHNHIHSVRTAAEDSTAVKHTNVLLCKLYSNMILQPDCVCQDVDMPRLWAQLIGAGASEAPRAVSVDPGMDVDSEGECLSSLVSTVHTAPISKFSLILLVANRHAQCDILLHCLNMFLFRTLARKYRGYYCSFCHVYQVTWTTCSLYQHLSAACVSIYLEFCPYKSVFALLLGFCSGVPPMVPTMVKLPGQSRSMIQLLPPPADLDNSLTAVDIARSAEVVKLQTLPQACFACNHLSPLVL